MRSSQERHAADTAELWIAATRIILHPALPVRSR